MLCLGMEERVVGGLMGVRIIIIIGGRRRRS